ncbi:MAG: hypothetical protein LM517_01085 [Nitrosomonas sp.]|nr:hypothetical protein [Nitrosomonas sp.]
MFIQLLSTEAGDATKFLQLQVLSAKMCAIEKLDQLMNPITKDSMSKPNQGELSLCITAGEKDSKLAQKIADLLAELNHVSFSIPPVPEEGQSIEEYNAGLRSLLNDVDGIILPHSQENPMWLQAQRTKVRKVLAQRPPPWGAFVDGSPPESEPTRWNDPGFMYLDCRNGLSVEPIQQFINTLQKGV